MAGLAAPPRAAPALATLDPAPLGEGIAIINKQSQNLHAELLLRRLGLATGTGSIADGQAVVRAMLAEAPVVIDGSEAVPEGRGVMTVDVLSLPVPDDTASAMPCNFRVPA